MTDSDLLLGIQRVKDIMIMVATGGGRIQDLNDEFRLAYEAVRKELVARRIENPIPYSDLWAWHGRWSNGSMPAYRDRRLFVSELFEPLIRQIQTGHRQEFEPTGWERVDRTINEIRLRLAQAETEEHFQTVGLLCREVLISTAQAVYNPSRHPIIDGTKASDTDAKRMLEAYVAVEVQGSSNDFLRKHARAALDLAVHLQHRRTATFRDAAICAEATTSVVNLTAIIAGLRNPMK